MMHMYGCRQAGGGLTKGSFPSPGRSSGSRFMEELERTADAAAVKKTKDPPKAARDDAGLQILLDRLTPASKAVLSRIQAGTNRISREEWSGLCKELETLGAISESDLRYTSADFHLIPLGYWDENGAFVQYELPMELKNRLLSRAAGSKSPSEDGLWACLDDSGWTGDPLAYLDHWIASLWSWQSDLARMRNGDGSPRYSDFSPITNQLGACRKVAALVKELCQAQAGKEAV